MDEGKGVRKADEGSGEFQRDRNIQDTWKLLDDGFLKQRR